jgi:PAS domain S-box-containing protein
MSLWVAALWLALVAAPVRAHVPDFAEVFEKQGVVMLLIDPASGRIVDANPAAADFYGHPRDLLKTMTIQQINTFDAQQVADERALAERESRNYFIFRHRLADGAERTVEVYSQPFDAGGRRLLLSMVHDITPGRDREPWAWHYQQRLEDLVAGRTAEAEARRRTVLLLLAGLAMTTTLALALVLAHRRRRTAEAGLRKSEALYRTLFDANPHPMWVYDLETLRFLAVNDAAVAHYGYARDEFLRMTIKDIRPAEDLPRLYKVLEGLPADGVDQAGVWRHVKKDGKVIDVEITSHVLDFDGRKAQLVLSHDITERLRAEGRLRESNERLKKVLEVETVGVMFWDLASGCMSDANDTFLRMMGYSRDELNARALTWQMLTPPECEQASLAEIRKFYERGRIGPYEKQYLRKDGSRLWMILAGSSLGGDACVEFCVDITDRKQAEALVIGQNQVLGMIASGAALPESLNALVRHVESQVPEMLGSILLLDDDGVHVRHGAAPSLPAEFIAAIDGSAIGPDAGSCGTAVFNKDAVVVEDIASDPLWADYRSIALPHGLRACWSTPILDGGRHVLGSFALYYRQPGQPRQEHRRLIDMATQTAAIAISHHRAEGALRQSEEGLRATFEQAAVGIAHVSPDGRWLKVNQKLCDIVGYSVTELLSKSFQDITHPDDLDADLSHVHQMLAGVIQTYSLEKRYIRRDGSLVWINLTVALVRDHAGKPSYFISIVEDISERKRIGAELQHKLAELQQWYEVMLGREARVIELKRETNALARELGRPEPYDLSFTDPPGRRIGL